MKTYADLTKKERHIHDRVMDIFMNDKNLQIGSFIRVLGVVLNTQRSALEGYLARKGGGNGR